MFAQQSLQPKLSRKRYASVSYALQNNTVFRRAQNWVSVSDGSWTDNGSEFQSVGPSQHNVIVYLVTVTWACCRCDFCPGRSCMRRASEFQDKRTMTNIVSCQTRLLQDDDRALGHLAPAAVTDTCQLYEPTFINGKAVCAHSVRDALNKLLSKILNFVHKKTQNHCCFTVKLCLSCTLYISIAFSSTKSGNLKRMKSYVSTLMHSHS